MVYPFDFVLVGRVHHGRQVAARDSAVDLKGKKRMRTALCRVNSDPDSLDARLFRFAVLAVAPASSMVKSEPKVAAQDTAADLKGDTEFSLYKILQTLILYGVSP